MGKRLGTFFYTDKSLFSMRTRAGIPNLARGWVLCGDNARKGTDGKPREHLGGTHVVYGAFTFEFFGRPEIHAVFLFIIYSLLILFPGLNPYKESCNLPSSFLPCCVWYDQTPFLMSLAAVIYGQAFLRNTNSTISRATDRRTART